MSSTLHRDTLVCRPSMWKRLIGICLLLPLLAASLEIFIQMFIESLAAIRSGVSDWLLFAGFLGGVFLLLFLMLMPVAIGLSSFLVLRVRDDEQVGVSFLGKPLLAGRALGTRDSSRLYILLHEDFRSRRFPWLSLLLLFGILIDKRRAVAKISLVFHRKADRKELTKRLGEYSGTCVPVVW